MSPAVYSSWRGRTLAAAFVLISFAPHLAAQAVVSSPPREAHAQSVELLRDGSVAESLERRVNVDFSAVRIDGEKTNVSLSSLTADQVLAAETTKVPTPDMDADAVGGLLQLTSRRAFEQKRPTLRGSFGVGYDSLVGRVSPEASVTFGRTLGAKEDIGFVVTLSGAEEHDRGEWIDTDWASFGTGAHLEEVALFESVSRSTEATLNALLDWRVTPATIAQFRASFSREEDTERGHGLVYRPENRTQPETLTTVTRSVDEDRDEDTTLTAAASLVHTNERWEADLRVSHTREEQSGGGGRDYSFRQRGVGIDYDISDPRFPGVRTRAGQNDADAEQFLLDEFKRNRGWEVGDDSVASLDLRVPNLAGWPAAWLKTGGKVRVRRTDREYAEDVYSAAGDGLRLHEALGAYRRDDFLEGRYPLHTLPDAASLRGLFASAPERFDLDVEATRADTDPSNYDLQQRVYAGYVMGSAALGPRTRLLAGVRVEHTANTFSSYEVLFDDAGRYDRTNPVGAESSYTNWFPGIHATHTLTPRVRLFASWTQSIKRPDYGQLVPARRVNRASTEINEGNPALRPTLYVNYDAAVEYGYADDGWLSLELFHRDISDTRFTRRTVLVGGPYDGYERSRPENGGGAQLQGAELEWRQGLGAWSEALAGWQLEAHYTHTRSEQEVLSRPGEEIPLVDLPRHEWTVQLSYERGGFYGRVEMNQESRQLTSVAGAAHSDRFEPTERRWDLSLSYEFSRRWRVFLDVENLTEEPGGSYEGVPERVEDYFLARREFRVGLKWER